MKRVVRDVHPLGNRDNATIIVAFVESWVSNDIKEAVRKGGDHLKMTKQQRKRAPEVIKINPHYPVILECLRNEALRARRSLIAAGNTNKRYICNDSMKFPWVLLYEIENDNRKPIAFEVEDGRLVDPARTLAILSINKLGDFKPFRMLSADEKKEVPTGVMTIIQTERME